MRNFCSIKLKSTKWIWTGIKSVSNEVLSLITYSFTVNVFFYFLWIIFSSRNTWQIVHKYCGHIGGKESSGENVENLIPRTFLFSHLISKNCKIQVDSLPVMQMYGKSIKKFLGHLTHWVFNASLEATQALPNNLRKIYYDFCFGHVMYLGCRPETKCIARPWKSNPWTIIQTNQLYINLPWSFAASK